jgi:hypothetical protein
LIIRTNVRWEHGLLSAELNCPYGFGVLSRYQDTVFDAATAGVEDDRPRAALKAHKIRSTYENALPLRTPSFLKTIAAGQKPVNEAWIMFSPANAVSKYQ